MKSKRRTESLFTLFQFSTNIFPSTPAEFVFLQYPVAKSHIACKIHLVFVFLNSYFLPKLSDNLTWDTIRGQGHPPSWTRGPSILPYLWPDICKETREINFWAWQKKKTHSEHSLFSFSLTHICIACLSSSSFWFLPFFAFTCIQYMEA